MFPPSSSRSTSISRIMRRSSNSSIRIMNGLISRGMWTHYLVTRSCLVRGDSAEPTSCCAYNLHHQDQQENKVVLKTSIRSMAFQEYARQKKFYDAGYPTPKPYLFINYFSALGALLREEEPGIGRT